ncbi:MAG TPA: histidine--tRNA ligase [Pseudobacteroides sp.]|uniref:histidine--tRNA ligase n=1 Tax=Pseudobacteroides sp. TaxID=1968840 RepID=UPI002F940EAA
MLTQTPKGTKDILPIESYKWQYIESQIAKVCTNFGYKEIRTPVFEHTELFQRGVGDTTDIVQKEMYTFLDKGNRSISLRPEGTAGVVRSYIENGMSSQPQPVKLYYNISAYRYEKMAKGRYREFHQFGVEAFGSKGPSIDVEIISLISLFFESLGLKDVGLNINSIGCPVCRKAYNEKLMNYFRPSLEKLCGLCNNRFERNPLRIIDCKEEKCKSITSGAPAILDNLCGECKEHFEGLKKGLDNLGIAYNIDKNIVRGLDYYTKTVFEFISENVGTQGTICGGGRYDGLVEACGGPSTPAIGFGLGIERLLMEMESQGVPIPLPQEVEIYIATIGEIADTYAGKLVYELRKRQIPAEKDLLQKSLKAQMKYADKLGAKYTIVLGDDEIKNNKATLKSMKNGEQIEVALDNIHEEIINRR